LHAAEHAERGWAGEPRRFGEGVAVLVGDLAFVYADVLLESAPPAVWTIWNELRIELLRPLDWIAGHEAAAGQTIELDLPELSAKGPAKVQTVKPCPRIHGGPGQVVTGTFVHQSSLQILNLQIEGEDEPIGVTDNHPIWSETRQTFVEAGKLRIGEELLTLDGTTKVTSITPRGPPEPVYNLEVHGEHVYHVAASGVLVHNTCGVGNTTRLGVPRKNPSDWRKLRDTWDDIGYGDILSPANRQRIANDLTPRVDDDWITHFPGDKALFGEKIPMHHIQGSPLTVPLPASRHLDAHMPGGFRYNPGGPGISG